MHFMLAFYLQIASIASWKTYLKTFFMIRYLQAIMEIEQCSFLRQGFIHLVILKALYLMCLVILKLHQNNQHIPVPRQRHVD